MDLPSSFLIYSATRKFGIKALRPDVRDLCDVYYPFKGSAGVDKAILFTVIHFTVFTISSLGCPAEKSS